ncbi:universal stress protein [Mesonia aquimarina]|uniref:universal stress protein n=1 Tax=Mesonia aquimarina TaxID=1504967 RepID=UPI000EF5F9EF|nr:universal stress protein [Mesonia aquimarina]
MKKILVPTDFSEQAESALKVAAQLAKKYDGEIFLLHMLELPMELIDPTTQSNTNNPPEALFFMRLAHQRFEDMMSRDFLKDVNVHETVEFHQAFEGIMEVSKKHDCDLIVMGSHGATGLKEVFIGSNTEKVVRHANLPVLVIKNDIPLFDVQNFVFASDFVDDGKESFLEAVDFAKEIGAKMHLVYINTANKFKTTTKIENRINKFIKGAHLGDHTITVYNDESIEKGILNFSAKVNAGLIGISTHGRKGIAHFLNGSIGEDLVNHAKRPVITFKIK